MPATVAQHIADDLSELLAERDGGRRSWDVRFAPESRAHDARDDHDLSDVAREWIDREGWDVAVSLTDLPLEIGRRPVAAEAYAEPRVVVVSLPALGPFRARRRARDAIVRLVDGLVDGRFGPARVSGREPGLGRRLRGLVAPVRWVAPSGASADVRLVAAPVRGHLRLLGGMVRANRPWRVMLVLSRALVVSLSTGAVALITSTTWDLGAALCSARLAAITVMTLGAMVAWLIVVHHLWESPSAGLDRQLAPCSTWRPS